MGARYYDAQVGRFITRDTYLNQHPYLYCDHDPVNHVDPTGHQTLKSLIPDIVIEIGFIGGVIGNIDPNWGVTMPTPRWGGAGTKGGWYDPGYPSYGPIPGLGGDGPRYPNNPRASLIWIATDGKFP